MKPGDEVVTVSHTWISTAWAISYVNATPVFCDIDPATCGMDPKKLEAAITSKTKAILPVHLYGQPVDLDPILAIAKAKNIPVIEDTAQRSVQSTRVSGSERSASRTPRASIPARTSGPGAKAARS